MTTKVAGDKATTAAVDAPIAIPPNLEKPKITFLDLPTETQRDIISHCSQSDLICVALVSKHFHELASAQLYRNFHIIFPDEDDINFDSPIDGLAGGLDTFTTSNYNYAKHLKDISMDTLSAGPKGENSYQPYLYSTSCGKFLNTLLGITLKKAKTLEAFRWNIRVELSRPVYRELHQMTSLKKLHIRMQAGESYYMPPPPLPALTDTHLAPGPSNHWSELPSLPIGPMSMMTGPPGTTPPIMPGPPPPPLGFPSKSLPKSRAGKRAPIIQDPSTLSGFKNLKNLSVLDIDDLDIINELNTCIRNSSSTLTELQLSLSDSLAAQARKPPPESDPDDSDADDEFQVIAVSQNTNYDTSGPAKAFRAQEERKVQEAVLGRIFDIEPTSLKRTEKGASAGVSGSKQESNEKGKEKEKPASNPGQEFLESIKSISSKLMFLSHGSRDFSASQQEILETIEKAAKKYVEANDSVSQSGETVNTSNEASRESTKNDEKTKNESPKAEDLAATTSKDKEGDVKPQKEENKIDQSLEEVASLSKPSRVICDSSPDDIDIAHVEAAEDAFEDSDDQQSSDLKGNINDQPQTEPTANDLDPPSSGQAMKASDTTDSTFSTESNTFELSTQTVNFESLVTELGRFQEQADALGKKIEGTRDPNLAAESTHFKEAETQLRKFSNYVNEIQSHIKAIEEEIEDAERQSRSSNSSANGAERSMKQYIRDTRGMSLTSLGIHLIPVKASIFSRAINLGCLKQLTLLNVGNQAPIWTMLTKENKARPLALRSVFTDNVSHAFLTCASQLEELHELFLLERSTKYKPESFAPRTIITIDQIRRLVLKKHIGTLKRLMIKDESSGSSWDSNEKAMILICTRGRQLEELAVSMNIHAVHSFMQYFSGLVNLRAINILHFRNNDTCIWVVREILRFIVDNLSHHPELKLEWIAMEDDRVDRVVRPSETDTVMTADEAKKRAKNKGKGKGYPVGMSSGPHGAFPVLPADSLDSESDSEDDGFDSGTHLRFKTVGPLQFYDVWGIKIFEKEIRTGRL